MKPRLRRISPILTIQVSPLRVRLRVPVWRRALARTIKYQSLMRSSNSSRRSVRRVKLTSRMSFFTNPARMTAFSLKGKFSHLNAALTSRLARNPRQISVGRVKRETSFSSNSPASRSSLPRVKYIHRRHTYVFPNQTLGLRRQLFPSPRCPVVA